MLFLFGGGGLRGLGMNLFRVLVSLSVCLSGLGISEAFFGFCGLWMRAELKYMLKLLLWIGGLWIEG